MSDPLTTVHLGLPYIAAAQAQKHVTHNEALRRLDEVVQLAVLDSTTAAPPGAPAEGDRYIVAAGATAAWAGHEGEVAAFVDGAWEFSAPEAGRIAFDGAAEAVLMRAPGGDWEAIADYVGAFTELGVNGTADATNRLVVRSAAVLFKGIEAADGGTGDIRVVVDKEAAGDTASVLFQSGASGRAEIGLAGDTDFVFKVSPDGSSWTEAIRIDKDTGLATILYDNGASGLIAGTVQDAIDEIAAVGGGGAVASVFGRTGTVVAVAGDYAASGVTFTPAGAVAATNVQAAIAELDSEKLPATCLDTDGTLAANSDSKIASQKATKTYVDQIVAAQDAMVFKGVIDCSANPNYPAADRGWTYRVSVAGKIGGGSGVTVEVGDFAIGLTDGTASGNQATVGAAWSVFQANLDGAVIGPASVTDSRPALFDGTTGKLLKQAGQALVATVFGRTGAVVSATGDYAASQVDFTPAGNIAATNLQAAVEEAAREMRGFRNVLHNGGFQVAQRGDGPFTSVSSPVNNDDTYLLDGCIFLANGSDTCDVSRVADSDFVSGWKIRLDVETSNRRFGILFPVEKAAFQEIRFAGSASIQFKARRTGTSLANLRAYLLSWNGTADAITSDAISAWGSAGGDPTFVANWTAENVAANIAVGTATALHKIDNIAVDTASVANLALLIISDPTTTTVGDFLDIGDVQVESGAVATSYEHRPEACDLALCRPTLRTMQLGFLGACTISVGSGSVGSFDPPMLATPSMTQLSSVAANRFPSTGPSAALLTAGGWSVYKVASSTGVDGHWVDVVLFSAEL